MRLSVQAVRSERGVRGNGARHSAGDAVGTGAPDVDRHEPVPEQRARELTNDPVVSPGTVPRQCVVAINFLHPNLIKALLGLEVDIDVGSLN